MEHRDLPVIDNLVSLFKEKQCCHFENIVFICVQHLLHTTVNLMEAIIKLGAKPENIFFLGKHYSYCQTVFEHLSGIGIQCQELLPLSGYGSYYETFNNSVASMWNNVLDHIESHRCEGIVILDDGGRNLEFIAKNNITGLPTIVGVEQTTAGLFSPLVSQSIIRFVDVATSAAKINLEAHLIIEAIIEKSTKKIAHLISNSMCGIVGFGTIGRSLLSQLESFHDNICIYDIKAPSSEYSRYSTSLEKLLFSCDLIFGCTGRDFLSTINLEDCINSNKTFVSCTSEDKEFLTLLKYLNKDRQITVANYLKDIEVQLTNNQRICILNGGFPINFDNSGESVTAEKIQLTRGLLLSAIIQAVKMLEPPLKEQHKQRIMLDPYLQKIVVSLWGKYGQHNIFSKQNIQYFNNTQWIIENSGGYNINASTFKELLEKQTSLID